MHLSAGVTVRRLEDGDAAAVADLIVATLRTTNRRDYSEEYIEDLILRMQPQDILERARWTHFYVVCAGAGIVGCGAIGPYWGKEDESSLFNVFVRPDWQGLGIGRLLLGTLEADEYGVRARRIEIPASITAVPFYCKLGYTHKAGVLEPDEEGLLRLEKWMDGPGGMRQ